MREIILLARFTMGVGTKRGFAWVVRTVPTGDGRRTRYTHRYEGIKLPVATARLKDGRKEITKHLLEEPSDREINFSSRDVLTRVSTTHFLEVEFFHL